MLTDYARKSVFEQKMLGVAAMSGGVAGVRVARCGLCEWWRLRRAACEKQSAPPAAYGH
jgi:hypothetical protein